MSEFNHESVMAKEVIQLLHPKKGDVALDATLGLGGHAKLLAEQIGASGHLIGIDADEENLTVAKKNLKECVCKKTLIHSNFIDVESFDVPKLNILFADIGISSPHIEDAKRGFSFQHDAPLDMRFTRNKGLTAAALIHYCSEQELQLIFQEYGELEKSKTLAKHLKQDEPQTTFDLKKIVETVYGYKANRVIAQVFQALRIEVNKELEALSVLISFAENALKPGGRLGILTFHSLEDRIVKQKFKALCTPEIDTMTGAPITQAPFIYVQKKPLCPSAEEVKANPRSRSAKFRVLQKCSTFC